MQRYVTTSTAVWIATALLHKENPGRRAFLSKEISERVQKEGLLQSSIPTLQMHISQHCVANKPANPDTHKKLYAVGRGLRRLYLPRDDFHPSRKDGKVQPSKYEMPEKYHYLLDWYEEFLRGATSEDKKPVEEESRFAQLVERIRKLTPEQRWERAHNAIRAIIAYERRRSD